MEITPAKLLEEAQSMAFEIRLLRQQLTQAEQAAATALHDNEALRASIAQRPAARRGRRKGA